MGLKTLLYLIIVCILYIIKNCETTLSASQLGWTEVTKSSESSHSGSTSESSSSETNDYHSYEVKTSSGSSEIQNSELSSDDIKKCLQAHNFFRAKVANGEVEGQPSASNMNEIKWDKELAAKAQDWASKCKFEHNKPTTKKFPYIGQNIHQSSSTDCKGSKKNMSEAVEMWFNEVKDPGYKVQFSSQDKGFPFIFSEGCGHFTQMIWANITHVGCGYVDYKTSSNCHNHLIVCNYGPGGNVVGENIYKFGSPASSCKTPSQTFPGLCS